MSKELVPPETRLEQALETMEDNRIGSIIVAGADRVPLGIFTLQDLLRRVALKSCDLEQPISQVMTTEPVTLNHFIVRMPPHASAVCAACSTRK